MYYTPDSWCFKRLSSYWSSLWEHMVLCFLVVARSSEFNQLRILSLPLIFFLCFRRSSLFKNFEKRQPIESLHDELRSLFAFIFEEGLLADNVRMVWQIQSFHYLVFKAGFIKVIRNGATNLLHSEELIICDPLAFFDGSVSALSKEFLCLCNMEMVAQLRLVIICL